jgi:diguanylate cyclase (GGDEF)-like protein
MKIADRLTIATLIPLIMAVVLSITAFVLFHQVNTALEQSRQSIAIVDSIAELNFLAGSYLVEHHERTKEQFILKHESLMLLLSKMQFRGVEEQALFMNIYRNTTYVREVFNELVAFYEEPGIQSGEFLQLEIRAALAGQLRTYSRELSSTASALVVHISKRTASAQNTANALIIALTLGLALLLTMILTRAMNRITFSINELRRGTEIIGSGNLDHKVGTSANDEIGDLSRSFDRMTDQLKLVTVSRDALSHEVAERKEAEAQIRKSKEFSDALNEIDIIIHSSIGSDAIMEKVVIDAAKAIGADASLIGVFQGELFEVKHAYNMPAKPVRYCAMKDLNAIRHSASAKQVVAFEDAAADERLDRELVRNLGLRSVLYAPLIVRDMAIGVIGFYYFASRHEFSDIHLDFARKLAASLSLALERAELYEEIRHMAQHDALTGLPNRKFLTDLLQLELAQARRNRKKMALLFLDLDRFKYINDTLGHDIGDKLIVEVSDRLRQTIRASDTVARFGGDEFNILMADITHTGDVITIAQKIITQFRTPYFVGDHELRASTSIGISVYPDDGEDVETLMKSSDIAMYHAKELGGNTYQFYSPSMNIRTVERLKIETELRQSLERGEMVVYYQPQLSIDTRKIVSAEALVRWMHPELGLLSPVRFIQIAEETGFITSIDEWMLLSVCRQINKWHEDGFPDINVTVNLSARVFQNPELAYKIAEILKKTGVSPAHLDIEISEEVAMSNIDRTAKRMTELAGIGVHISIDDFGTGYSSLNHLKRLPVGKLKIDRSFIQDIATDPDDRAVISAMTAMAHNMRLKVLAEGVETEDQLFFLHSTRCDEAQGYLFSKPLPAEEFGEFLSANR